MLLVIDIAANFVVAVVVTTLIAVLIVALWFAVPRAVRRRYPAREIGPMHLGEPFEPAG